MIHQSETRSRPNRSIKLPAAIASLIAIAIGSQVALGQFTSGSDGSDGALDYTGQSGTIIFDPDEFIPPLDPDHDNVFHFTSITIPSGVTLVMRAPQLNWAPVTWLATGLIEIDGTLDLSGGKGHDTDEQPLPSTPGPGGFPGGMGKYLGIPSQDGFGPGGGLADNNASNCFAVIDNCGSHGRTCYAGQSTYGNTLIQPLTGGSGGGGCYRSISDSSYGGGAGGGAILIASSLEIRVSNSGRIDANGGIGGDTSTALAGGGGAIRLVSPIVGGGGSVRVRGRNDTLGAGYIRIESTNYTGLSILGGPVVRRVPLTASTPLLANLASPTVRIVGVDGILVPNTPTADFVSPDILIDSDQEVLFAIEAHNVQPGATVDVYIYPMDFTFIVTTSMALTGTFELSTATATTVIPPGLCLSTVRAVITP